jgi:16S rRNA (uracil1498-N3)-methyltransferase
VTAPLFLAPTDALAADRIVLDGPEGRHAADVRRLRAGEAVDVADGRGLLVQGVVVEASRGRLVIEVRQRLDVPQPSPRLVGVQATAKGGRDTDAVEAMTEVGVDAIVGWEADRSVARWTERTSEKWATTAREAAKQARRPWVPDVSGPLTTAQVAELLRASALALVLHESATDALPDVAVPPAGDVVVVIGPEGGITDEELEAFAEAGARTCRIGRSVLRTSTAGVAALSILLARKHLQDTGPL